MSHKENDKRFCSEAGIATVRRQIRARGGGKQALSFLIMSGSFDPVHTQHIRAFNIVRKRIERTGRAVVGGFLAPSTDDYVQVKIGERHLTLKQRLELCELAIKGTSWLSVCRKAEFSSNVACHGIRHELEQHCSDLLDARPLKGVEIMGSDTVMRIFQKILPPAERGPLENSWQRGRVVCCIPRAASSAEAESEEIKKVLLPGLAALGIELIFVKPLGGDPLLEPVSSSAVRELIATGNWEELRSKGWLHSVVLNALQRM
jgi:hypothetical protein